MALMVNETTPYRVPVERIVFLAGFIESVLFCQILNFDFNKQAVELWNITCQPQQQPSFNQEV